MTGRSDLRNCNDGIFELFRIYVEYGARINESRKSYCVLIVLSRDRRNSVFRFSRVVSVSDNRTKVQFVVQWIIKFGGLVKRSYRQSRDHKSLL